MTKESASIAAFSLRAAGNVHAYYAQTPQNFLLPAVYFPPPEVTTKPDILGGFATDWAWYVNVFATDRNGAAELAQTITGAIQSAHRLIPLLDETGEKTGVEILLKPPSWKVIDDIAAQVTLNWTTREPYNSEPYTTMKSYEINLKG